MVTLKLLSNSIRDDIRLLTPAPMTSIFGEAALGVLNGVGEAEKSVPRREKGRGDDFDTVMVVMKQVWDRVGTLRVWLAAMMECER